MGIILGVLALVSMVHASKLITCQESVASDELDATLLGKGCLGNHTYGREPLRRWKRRQKVLHRLEKATRALNELQSSKEENTEDAKLHDKFVKQKQATERLREIFMSRS